MDGCVFARGALAALALAASSALAQPANLYPADGASGVSSDPAFEIDCDDTRQAGQYQISASGSFTSPLYDSGTAPASICNHVADADLDRGVTFFWRARVQSGDGTWSSWSSSTSFTTVPAGTRIGRLELRDGVQGYAGNADADIRGSYLDPDVAIREFNQGLQDVLRTGRRPAGNPTDEIYRTLIEFDLTDVTPSTPVVNAYLELTGEGLHADTVDFRQASRAHRLLVHWDEWNPAGADHSCCGDVEPGEVSWTFRSNPLAWNEPGAAGVEIDRSFAPLFVTNFRNLPGDVTQSSGSALVDLVQLWVDDPTENHGLLLISTDEDRQRAMNLSSSDHANEAWRPALVLELEVNELIDLELSLPAPSPAPVVGEPFDLVLELRNTGPDAASGVATQVILPSGYSLTDHSASSGSFNTSTRVWSVPGITAGQTQTLTLTGTHAASEAEVRAAVIAADQLDADSYPDNHHGEDDDVVRVVALEPGSGGTTESFFFDGGTEGFEYLDDAFGTAQPNYVQGFYSGTGGFNGGGLVVELGGVNNNTITNISGGWRYGFSLPSASTVSVSFRYRLTDTGTLESTECTQLLASVNGSPAPGGSPIDEICGQAPVSKVAQDTGWQQGSFQVSLGAGNHVVTLGGLLTQKTSINERAAVFLDEVVINIGGASGEDDLTASPTSLSLTAEEGSSASASVDLATTAGTQTTVSISDDAPWLGPVAGGDTPFSTQVVADAGSLAPGTYSATITASASGFSAVSIPVTFTVTEASSGGSVITDAGFDSGTEGFSYQDDAFGTSQPTYAQGSYGATSGFSGGGLVVELGGVNNNAISNISGGWQHAFSLPSASTVSVSFRYRLTDTGTLESTECTQMLARVNGSPAGASPIHEICGQAPVSKVPQDTGWQQGSFQVSLGAGNHVVTLGGLLTQKTSINERAGVFIDDVLITTGSGGGQNELTAAPTSLSLTAAEGASASANLDLATTAGTQTTVSISDDAPWLGPVAGGSTPFSTQVVANAGSLAPGSYSATITASASGLSSISIPVTFTVTEASSGGSVITDAGFDSGTEGFSYQDDAFGTSQPSYAQGSYGATSGFSGGGLVVNLGGIDNNTISNISGGWQHAFSLVSASTVSVSFRYRLTDTGTLESTECTQMLARVNGAPAGASPIHEICGQAPVSKVPQDTGWQQASFQVPLGAGNHVVTLGGLLTRKTSRNERAGVSIDDVLITTGGGSSAQNELTASPSSLSLAAAPGDTTTTTLALATTGEDETTVSVSNGVAWLEPIPGGTTPLATEIVADTTGLADGVYTATVTATSEGFDPISIPVTLTVTEPAVEGEVLFEAGFDSGTDGFDFQDDLFQGTTEPDFASGSWLGSGGADGGGLEVFLGGGSGTVTGMSGGYVRSFALADEQFVTLSLRYRHFDSGTFEADECSQLIVAVDGVQVSTTALDHLNQFCGNLRQTNVSSDTGWRFFQIPLLLSAGNHTVAIGGYNNRKSSSNERVWLRFDDVRVEAGYQELAAFQISPTSLGASVAAGASTSADIDVSHSSGGSVVFELAGDAPWIVPDAAGGSTPDTVSVTLDSALAPSAGIYTGTVRVSADGHNDAFIPVSLTVQ